MILALVCLPAFVFYVIYVFEMKARSLWLRLLLFLVCVPASVLLTPFYILFVIGVGCNRLIRPEEEDIAASLKSMEIFLESAPQACLGKLTIIMISSALDPILVKQTFLSFHSLLQVFISCL